MFGLYAFFLLAPTPVLADKSEPNLKTHSPVYLDRYPGYCYGSMLQFISHTLMVRAYKIFPTDTRPSQAITSNSSTKANMAARMQ